MNRKNRKLLLKTARDAIKHGLNKGCPLAVNLEDYPKELSKTGASFVTLEKNGHLRGCIGMLEATRPLIEDIAENAYSAAFRDPRFPPIDENELEQLDIHLSILSPSEPILFVSEEDLISQIRPGIDGLIIQEGARRGTFLPSVWESLSKPEQFLNHLKQKAGLPADYWSDTLRVYRYTTEYIE